MKKKYLPGICVAFFLSVIFLAFSACAPNKTGQLKRDPVDSLLTENGANANRPAPPPDGRRDEPNELTGTSKGSNAPMILASLPGERPEAGEENQGTQPLPSEAYVEDLLNSTENIQKSETPSSPSDGKKRAASPAVPEKQIPKKSDQQLLDGALEFCQASNDFWKRGDLDNALDALDQAYSLVLQVQPDDNPEILQQREDLRFTIAKRIIEVYSSRFTVANGYHKAIPLSMNRYVKKAIRQFTQREKKFFLQSYKRSGRYRPAILKALRKAGLPDELSWLPLIESGFSVRAFSKARALGLWQFIASTGYKFGLERDRWIDERMDAQKSTLAAISYLKELHQIFGDWTTVLAAYNCGEGTVLRTIRTQRANYLDNFWDLYEKLPRETAYYVPKFLAVLHILQDPKKYGMTLPPLDPPEEFERVTIDKPMRLKSIAKSLDIPYEILLRLNPELKRQATPAASHDLKVPRGMGPMLIAKLPSIPTWNPRIPAFVVHRVKRGEALSLIARKYRTSVRAIMEANHLRSSRYLRVGWKLKVPTGRRYQPDRPSVSSKSSVQSAEGVIRRYAVKQGDSLWEIARRFNTTTDAIKKANRLSSTHLSIGQILTVSPAAPTPSMENIDARKYRVRGGDSPYLIAQKHQMDLSQFLRMNKLTPRSTIFPGQILLVKTD
ncbi:MAG: LysM peptidoglycan-binding domain-containing protein [Desulfatiglandaceae bacterium]